MLEYIYFITKEYLKVVYILIYMSEFEAKVRKVGSSAIVTLPNAIIKYLEIQIGETIFVSIKKKEMEKQNGISQ